MLVMQGSGRLTCEIEALLSAIQSRTSAWLAAPPTVDPSIEECRLWRARLHRIAISARSSGLLAYSSLSLRIAEQLEPLFRSDSLPRWAVELLCLWSRASLGYLQPGVELRHADALVGLLRMPRSPGCYGAQERARLMRDLIEDREQLTQRSQAEEPPARLRTSGTH
jgi:hypothetical protein